MGVIVRIHCEGCEAEGEYFLDVGMLGSEHELACCRSCAELVVVTRDAMRNGPFTDACPQCGNPVERPYPPRWQPAADGHEMAPNMCPRCGSTLHLHHAGVWD